MRSHGWKKSESSLIFSALKFPTVYLLTYIPKPRVKNYTAIA
jgi:hypothetical protein